MPIWFIEIFGAADLDAAFLLITLMTAPLWIVMILCPSVRFVRHLAQPWLVAPLYAVVLVVLLWKSYNASLLPDPVTTASYASMQDFVRHPIAFLLLFCSLQITNLFMGIMMYQKSMCSGFRAPLELTLCWFLGALALIPFGIRLLLRRQTTL